MFKQVSSLCGTASSDLLLRQASLKGSCFKVALLPARVPITIGLAMVMMAKRLEPFDKLSMLF